MARYSSTLKASKMDKVKQKPSEISVIQLQPKNFSGFRYYFGHKILNVTVTVWELMRTYI